MVVIARYGTPEKLHFRIFDFHGTLALDASEDNYSGKAAEVAALKAYLQNKWNHQLLTNSEIDIIREYIESITGYAIDDRAVAKPDFDTLGLDSQRIYIAFSYQANRGHGIVAIPKEQLYGTGSLTPTLLYLPAGFLDDKSIIQPALNFDSEPVGGFAWLLVKGPPAGGTTYSGGPVYFRRLKWTTSTSADWEDTQCTQWRLIAPDPVVAHEN